MNCGDIPLHTISSHFSRTICLVLPTKKKIALAYGVKPQALRQGGYPERFWAFQDGVVNTKNIETYPYELLVGGDWFP